MKSSLKVALWIGFCVLAGCSATGISDVEMAGLTSPAGAIVPVTTPRPVKTMQIYGGQAGGSQESEVWSLTSKQIRERLTTTDVIVSIEQYDNKGSFRYLGAESSAGKGRYKVIFDYGASRIENVDAGGNRSVTGRIGVGFRITAELNTKASNLDLSGLMPIAFAVQNNKAFGKIHFQAYGMSHDKLPLVVPHSGAIDSSSIQKALEAVGAVKTLIGLDETKLEPYLIGIVENPSLQVPGY